MRKRDGAPPLLSALILCASLLGCTRDNADAPDPPPPVYERETSRQAPPVPADDVRALLDALHYLPARQPAPDAQGVVTYIPELADNGLNFVISGHAAEAILMDMKGTVMHTWTFPFSEIWKDGVPRDLPDHLDPNYYRNYWRRARLLGDGSLLVVFGGWCVLRIDRESHLVWKYVARTHHDLDIDDTGRVFCLTRAATRHPAIGGGRPVVEDYVVVLSPDGEETDRISMLDCFLSSQYADLLEEPDSRDVLHTNAVRWLDGSHSRTSPLFARGNLLMSFREINAIAIVDPAQERVLWAATGPWVAQHDPWLLDGRRILLFDNLGSAGNSRVIEFDPITERIVWVFDGGAENPFRTERCGTCQRLPNGNTLVTATEAGRAFEVTREGQIVWDYVNPHRMGSDNQLIATLPDVIRVTRRPSWLPGPAKGVATP